MIKKNRLSQLFVSLLVISSVSSVTLLANPAEARTSADDLKDVRADHWAYKAIKELVDKYDIMSGFPDGTFRGARTFSRYEAAAALYKVMLKVEEMMGSQQTSQPTPTPRPQIGNDDLKAIKDLVEEFRRELDAIKATNSSQYAKLKTLEEELEKVKKEFGNIRFGGDFSSGLDDTIEDTFRPSYNASYGLDMKATISEETSVSANIGGSFSSEVEEKDVNGVKKKTDAEKAELSFGSAKFTYSPANTFLNPKVKFGYMGMGGLISSGTSVTNYFGGAAGPAGPNLNSGAKKRGLRLVSSVTGGVELGSGPFTFAIAASPNTVATGVKMNFGLLKLKVAADADQALFFGEIVQDPIHNEAIIVDIGNDNFGTSFQANFRGVADDFSWRAASGLLYLNIAGFELGGSAKFENESSQQIIAGGFLKTPDKFGTLNVPSLTFALQEPLTILNGTIFEGSNLGDKAGISVSIGYDNPYLPGLSIYFDQKTNILFSDDPKDLISNSYGLSTSISF